MHLFILEDSRSNCKKWKLIQPGQVVDCNELKEGGVDEEHADPVPEVHGGQVGDHGQLGAEPGDMFVKLSSG